MPAPYKDFKVGLSSLLQRWSALVWLVVLAFLVSGCGSPEPQPLRFNLPPWQDGEVSVFRVTDLDDAYAGTTQFEFARAGEDGWRIEREISARDGTELVTVIARGTGLRPEQSILVRQEGDTEERVATSYNDGQADLELTSKQDVTSYQRINIPSDARDQRTLLMLVRALPLAKGYATRLNTFLPVMPLLDRVMVTVTGQENVDVPAGTFDTWRVELDTGDNKTEAWIGVAAPHQLIKYVDGRNGGTFELIEFRSGK